MYIPNLGTGQNSEQVTKLGARCPLQVENIFKVDLVCICISQCPKYILYTFKKAIGM